MTFVQLASIGAGVAQSPTGAVRAFQAGTIYLHDTLTPVVLYTDETGGGVLSSTGAFTTDILGRVPGWATLGLEVDITIPPASTVSCFLQGATGTTGPPGVGANWRGVWSAGTTYALGDGVTGSNGHNYISLAAGNIAHDPTTDAGVHWSDLLPTSAVIVGSTPSESGSTGDTFLVRSDGTVHRFKPTEISLRAFGADPTGVTDSSTAIQNWMNAVVNSGAGLTGKAESGTYKVSTAVGIANETSGEEGQGNFHLKGEPGCVFQWSGGLGSGNAFFFHSAHGTVEGITFSFSSSAYDGNLVDVDWSANPADCQVHFRECNFGAHTLQNPRCMLRLNHTISSTVRECHFYGGQYAIIVGDGNYVIANAIRDCVFNNSAIAHIYFNGGACESHTIDHCTFESLASGAAGAILTSVAADGQRGLTISNNWFGDVTTPGGTQIDIRPAVACLIMGNRHFANTGAVEINLHGNRAVMIANDWQVGGDANGNIIDTASLLFCRLIGNNLGVAIPTGGFTDAYGGFGNFSTFGEQPFMMPSTALFTYPNGQAGTSPDGYMENVGVHNSGLAAGYEAWTTMLNNMGAVTGGSGGRVIISPGAGDPNVYIKCAITPAAGAALSNGIQLTGGSGKLSLGFYGAAPVNQAVRAGQLTDSTGGAVSSTLAAGITDTVAKNAIASLAAKVNALETIIHNLGLSA